ncbi:hypothetical protein [Mycobacterium intracellulare]|nr:hypothetical protein [Mycobacterium intracellulare]
MTTTNHRPVDSTTRSCCHGIGRHTPNCLESSELIEGIHGSWLGRRGIFRHSQPSAEDAIVISKACGHPVSHVMSTAVSGEFSGEVVGELIRWADGHDDSITFEARIDGTPDSAGISDIAAYSYEDILALAKVSNDLRSEWAAILEGRR